MKSPESPDNSVSFVTLGNCRVCEQGLLGVRVCASDHPPLILCDECESIWKSPDTSVTPMCTKSPGSRCPICDQSMWDPPTYWANEEQIAELGWKDAIKGLSQTTE